MPNLRNRVAKLERQAATAPAMSGSGVGGLVHAAEAPDDDEPAWTQSTGWSRRLVEAAALKGGVSEERVIATLNDAMRRLRDADVAEPE